MTSLCRLYLLSFAMYNSGYTALVYASTQIYSLRSPTLYVRKTLGDILLG